jgi:hypothetical protein
MRRPASVCAEELALFCGSACGNSLVFFPLSPTQVLRFVRMTRNGNFGQIPVNTKELRVLHATAFQRVIDSFNRPVKVRFLKFF